jgi:serine/threonine protein phosphatase PrpC
MVNVFSYSEPGGHAENEDAFDVRVHPDDLGCYLCAVADGQGGQAGGAVASRIACKVCIDSAATYPSEKLLDPALWVQILQTADAAVCDDPDAGYTTLVAFSVTEGWICGASNGDSAALFQNTDQPGKILTERQYKNPPVGSRAAKPVSFSAKLVPPWTVLAMSDGVWKYVGWESIFQIVLQKHGQEIIDALRDRAKLPRTQRLQDDFTAVLLLGDVS